jgi:hypothetical protein
VLVVKQLLWMVVLLDFFLWKSSKLVDDTGGDGPSKTLHLSNK